MFSARYAKRVMSLFSINKRIIYAAAAAIIILACVWVGSSSSSEYELESVKIYDIMGDELKGPNNGFRGTISSDTGSIHDGTKLTLTYWGREYYGQVSDSFIFWDQFDYGNILSGASDGYTTISYGKKSVAIQMNCNYPLDDGTATYIKVVMDFEKK